MFRTHRDVTKNKTIVLHKFDFLFVRFVGTSWTNNTTSSPTRLDRNYRGRSNDGSVVDKQNVSASTPVKNDRSSGRIDMSSSNISPIHDCRASPAERRLPVASPPTDRYHRGLPAAVPTVSDRGNVATATKPFVPRSPSGRSAMDLYAAIHESKKRLLGGQQPSPANTTAVTAATVVMRQSPSTASVLAPPSQRPQPAAVGRQSNRYRPRAGNDEHSARYDFKRLLLQTNMAGGRRTQQSAVVRLQQPTSPLQPVTRNNPVSVAGRSSRGGPTSPSWKSNVLSSTIQEDCREDEDCYSCNGDRDGVLKSAALVNRTLKSLAAATTCSTLETAL